jgi:hypothetical protein
MIEKDLVFLIFDSKKDPRKTYNPINNILPDEAFSRPVRIASASTVPPGSKRSKPGGLEVPPIISGSFIYPGVNRISKEEVDFMKSDPLVGKEYFESGAFQTIDPKLAEGQTATGLSVDYSPEDALRIIPLIGDLEWLERSDRKEERENVSRSLSARINALKKSQTSSNSLTPLSSQFL